MTKRNSRYFDKTTTQVFKAMRDAIFKLGLEVKSTDKNAGTLKFVTKTSYFIFGGYEYTLAARSVSELKTQVTLSTNSDVSQKKVDEMADSIYALMDKELPLSNQK